MQTSIITFEGKLDNLVGFKNNKGTYSLRKRITPKNPNTEKQRNTRLKFLVANNLAAIFKHTSGMVKFAKDNKISPSNAFVKANYSAIVNVTPTGTDEADLRAKIDYDNITVAVGNAIGVIPERPNFETPQQITVPFDYIDIPGAINDDDVVVAVAYCPNLNAVFSATARRSLKSITLRTPSQFSGETVHVYLFTQNINDAAARSWYWTSPETSSFDGFNALNSAVAQSDFSNSVYAGQGQIG